MHRLIAMDVETHGDYFRDRDARILCCGAYGDGIDTVFDFDDPNQMQQCLDLVADPEVDITWHNCLFDNGWFYIKYNTMPQGVIHDTMTRAALIDEYSSLNLDDCCKRAGVKGKNKSETIEAWFEDWQKKMKGCAKGLRKGMMEGNQVFNPDTGEVVDLTEGEITALMTDAFRGSVWDCALLLWKEFPEFKQKMMEYNRQDCVADYNLFHAQEKQMKNLQNVYSMECRLIPILLRMKKVGIRFDMDRANQLIEKVSAKEEAVEKELIKRFGINGEIINSSKKFGEAMNAMGIKSPVRTPTGAQSWGEGALVRIRHPVIPAIFEYKNYHAILSKFLQGSLTSSVIDGRIHCDFLPMLREEGGGTVTGRFSCKRPNLQQIPSRDKGHGEDFSQDMRALFLPEEGQMLAADDYSQIEAVLLAHFAKGQQAEWFREQMRAGADLHNIVMGMTGITYRPVVKTFNYGCIYGMGWATAMEKNYNLFEKLAKEEGKDIETFTKEVYYNYHQKFPVVKDTMKVCQEVAKLQGYIDTMGGRRLHKPKAVYDPTTGKMNDFLYKMLNKLIQGTAADILKQALLTAWDAGIYDVLTLHLLVHDEQVNSVPFNKAGTEAAVELQRIMGDVYKDRLLVSIKASCELGPNWGYWSDDIYKEMQAGNFDPAFFDKDYKETH